MQRVPKHLADQGYVSGAEIARKLGYSHAHVSKRLVPAGLKYLRVNRRLMVFKEEEVRAWLKERDAKSDVVVQEKIKERRKRGGARYAEEQYAIRMRKWLASVLIDRRKMSKRQWEGEHFAIHELPKAFAQAPQEVIDRYAVQMVVEAMMVDDWNWHQLALALYALRRRWKSD